MAQSPFEFSTLQSWLKEAGDIALGYYQTQLSREQKADYSPVTEADKAVEDFLLDKIQKFIPPQNHAILAEETGGDWQQKEFVWAVDPIDGTRVFVDGLPMWCIAIGLLKNGEAYRGAVYLPVLDEMYYTDDEGHPFWNGRPLKGMLRTAWDRDSFIGVSSGAHRYLDIDFRRIRALGAIATHHVYVARGVAVAALHREAKIWDLAGAHAILTAVGGQAVYLDGSPMSLKDVLTEGTTRGSLLVGHPIVLGKLLPKINPRSRGGNQ